MNIEVGDVVLFKKRFTYHKVLVIEDATVGVGKIIGITGHHRSDRWFVEEFERVTEGEALKLPGGRR